VRSKADSRQLNLPQYTVTENNDKKLKHKKSQQYRKQTEIQGVRSEEREKSLWWK